MTRKRTGKNAANVVCVDRQGEQHLRHLWDGSGYCARCAVLKRGWQRAAARRRAGERLVGCRGKVVELANKEAK